MAIIINKTLPTSSFYTGSGAVSITLSGINSMTFNTKRDLLKIQIPKSPGNVANTGSDLGTTYVKDLKRITDNIKLRGWLTDNTGSSAWNQLWQLRGMTTVGGPCSSLVLEDKTFDTSSVSAYLEEVNAIPHTNRVQGLTINNTNSSSLGLARIEVDLSFFLGTAR
jgi:hypothetical protein